MRRLASLTALGLTLCVACNDNNVGSDSIDPNLAALEARVLVLETDLTAAQAQITTLETQLAAFSDSGTLNDGANPIDYTQLKNVPQFIICEYYNDADASQITGLNVRYWSVAECGGVLPDDTFVAVLGTTDISGAEDNFHPFTSDGTGNGPGLSWFSGGPGTGIRIRAVYLLQ